MHREACVAGNFVEALSGADCLVDCVIIVVYFIRFQCGFHSAGKAEAAELVVKHLKKKRRCLLNQVSKSGIKEILLWRRVKS